MRAFSTPLITRDLMIDVMIAHREADEFIAGLYGETHGGEFRGCAVGCSIHTINRVLDTNYSFADHDALANVIGVPMDLMWLQDEIFESLHAKDRVFWPERFYRAIPDGSDQFDTPRRISIRILREIVLTSITVDEWGCRDAVINAAGALESGDAVRINAARAAADIAHAAVVRDAADVAVRVAYATAADAAAIATVAHATAAYAVRVAAVAANAAACAACAAVAAGAARAARADAWQRIADIACEEMSSAPQTQVAMASDAALEITSLDTEG